MSSLHNYCYDRIWAIKLLDSVWHLISCNISSMPLKALVYTCIYTNGFELGTVTC